MTRDNDFVQVVVINVVKTKP